jgi:flavin reductase (DIM6/NTAB) family NADH-FMN oxidoreductase RutF
MKKFRRRSRMSRINLGAGIVNYPMPVALVGTNDGERANFMPAAWISMVSHTPPRIAVSLGGHKTREAIHDTGVFSVCFPSADDMEAVDYCGITSAAKTDKSGVFRTFTGSTGAPMAEECGLCVECRLDHIDKNGPNETLVADIVGVYAEERVLTDGRVDLKKLRPLLLSQMDTRYYTLGEEAGKAWGAGRKYCGEEK